MPLITHAELDELAQRVTGRMRYAKAAASEILQESTSGLTEDDTFDVFLSHSYADVRIDSTKLLGVKRLLEEYGYSVYVDWIVDKELNRESVNSKTARTLRKRMRSSSCLLFVASSRSPESKWMPWELGFMDGLSGRVAILPIVDAPERNRYKGQEYLGLYPYIEEAEKINEEDEPLYLWVCKRPSVYVEFHEWLNNDVDPYLHED